MRILAVLVLLLWPVVGLAQDWEDQQLFEGSAASQTLRVLSSTDTSFFAPIIQRFLREQPGWAIEYFVHSTAEIDRRFRDNPDGYDLVISSAMDLQLKLANDGYAMQINDISHPDWAQWRQSLFAFTTEPAAIVINRAAFAGHDMPQNRQDLIRALRARPEQFRGRLGTYDVRESALGYLFATQDARASETFWRLMEVMGGLDIRLYCCSGEMIDDLYSGKIAVAYNVLGSYALARRDTHDALEIILPSDFPTTMMRTAFVPSGASHPQMGAEFIRYLIALQSAGTPQDFPLPPLNLEQGSIAQSTIALEPALMTYLDRLKRRTFLKEWQSAIIQDR
ncbi:ABC transporter substrate-binding protein [Sulfitobacter mediterraneus]|uniref:ABC transporter substrate-binding protein n=1 Tax=Sulfitobacter mediterraneus TaxID=83219 RepID=UPI00193215DE|nr:ABC transporter substrate-binding protein [Sulfitobacter mediterraneus]MBM1631663.1 ABC transporter substrate-binding protein [Sulfitobacter mediterraneus]MBM1639478.1 ABC transporter substrate-binding protein [Sulfitobacter mediterraneus]MBM1643527.1 ABC transporter substrate-binding protein [Sulfitobacter mediterraneus]MBM1647573.1 ABC transporter substrate-binding protein [Sulfitobacter mediterraneus]MBM1651618.1 ABC transporter substrate-binding protein [Sulfitobacter mediterraneus]